MRKLSSWILLGMILAVGLGCAAKNSPSSPDNNGNPTSTPTPTVTSTPTTCLSCTPTFTGTATGTPTFTDSPTPTPTATSTPTQTTTGTSTSTATSSSTVTETPTSTPTATVTSTSTATSTPCTNSGILGDTPSSACCYVGYVKNQTMCRPVTLAQTSMVYDIQLYVSGPCSFLQVGIYADNGSHYPGSLITVSMPVSIPSTADQDFVLSLPATLLPAGTYWLAAYGNDPTAPFVYLKQSPSSGTAYFDNSGAPLPAIFQAATCCNSNSVLVQMGADYCY